MDRRVINPWTWQEQYGFNQGHEVTGADRTLYLAGQTSVDDDGQVVHAGDMVGQINKSIDNVEAVLTEAGMTLADVVRLSIYTTRQWNYNVLLLNINVVSSIPIFKV